MAESAWDKHRREQRDRITEREMRRRARREALAEEREQLRKVIRITPVVSPLQKFLEYVRGEVADAPDEDIRIFRM